MVVLTGKKVFDGVAVGRIAFWGNEDCRIKRRHAEEAGAQLRRFEDARQKAAGQLRELYEKAASDVGKEAAMIFQAHQMLLEDPEYAGAVRRIIAEQEVNAEYAVWAAAEEAAGKIASVPDTRIRGRAADVRDVARRVLHALSGSEKTGLCTDAPVIVAADDLTPGEIMQLDKHRTLGLALAGGSAASHTAILAGTMEIPVVIGLGEALQAAREGAVAVLDGFDGKLYIDPDNQVVCAMREKQAGDCEKKRKLEKLRGEDNVTRSGRRLDLYVNIGSDAQLRRLQANDVCGIGLLRTEFLYLQGDVLPTEEQQFAVYKHAAEAMQGKRVTIRTLDIGADKQAPSLSLDKEENPALGYRAIRICLTQIPVFRTQLRALLRASAYGRIAVLFPMITSVWEVKRIQEILEDVREDLREEGIPFDPHMEIGIMVETPAAVMESRALAREVDFLSVGTNDLTQYTLAVDRQNPKLDLFYDAHHPAVLAMIRMTADNAHAEGKRIGICGQLGADPALTETFLEMGIDELSVPPSKVLPLRERIRQLR